MRVRCLAVTVLMPLAINACSDSATSPSDGASRSQTTIVALNAAATHVFGPERFIRSNGSPVEVSRTLAAGPFGDVDPPFTLELLNGPPGTSRSSSAVVSIDGVRVVATSDLSQHVASLKRVVTVKAGSKIAVELRGAPGSAIELTIQGVAKPETPPTLVTPAQNARITQNDPTTGCPASSINGYGYRIAFSWTAATGPKAIAGYELTAGRPGAALPIVPSIIVAGTSQVFSECRFVESSLLDGWEWRVRARYADGSFGPSSAIGTFGFSPMPPPPQVLDFALSPPSYGGTATRVSLSGAVDANTSASVVLAAVVDVPQAPGPVAAPYPLIEFFWNNGGTPQKIGQALNPTLLQTATNRLWTYTFTWDPAPPTPTGAVSVVAVRTEYGGASSSSPARVVTIVP